MSFFFFHLAMYLNIMYSMFRVHRSFIITTNGKIQASNRSFREGAYYSFHECTREGTVLPKLKIDKIIF